MTNPEYLNLKNLLVQGGFIERMNLVESMTSRQLTDFAERLDLSPADYLEVNAWRWIAKVLAIRYSADLDRLDGPATCADPFAQDCTCTPCEMGKTPIPVKELNATFGNI